MNQPKRASRWTASETKVLKQSVKNASSTHQGFKAAAVATGRTASSCANRYYHVTRNAYKRRPVRKVTSRRAGTISLGVRDSGTSLDGRTLVVPIKSITLKNNALHITY
jgi:hypothetical protein